MRMERVNQILQHTLYQSCRRQIDEKEKDRIFCGHDMGHLLDVARLAWIFNLEANQEISKERIYAAALLHDIGRHIQYENGTPDRRASDRRADPDGLRILSGRDERDSLCDRKSPQQRDVKAG